MSKYCDEVSVMAEDPDEKIQVGSLALLPILTVSAVGKINSNVCTQVDCML